MKLARREKTLLTLAACFVAGFLLLETLVVPFFEKRKRLQRGIRAKEAALEEMVTLSGEYRRLKGGSRGLQRFIAERDKGFTLFAFLEREAGQAGVKDRIKYMKPSSTKGTGPYQESMVEMKLEGLTLKELAAYLYRIESPKQVVMIRRISIKENMKVSGTLEAVLQAWTYK